MSARAAALQWAGNLLGFAALVWFGGPLLEIASWRPLETRAARGLVLLLALQLLLLWTPLRRWLARRSNAALVDVLQPAAGPNSLEQRFRNALALLRHGIEPDSGPGLLRAWRARQQLVRMPWYLFIGAPGAGKTTALLNSGLQFPLAERLGTAPVRGAAGTRQCDWWFTSDAVFIDTAGRYTTQDSNAAADAGEWRNFLGLLRRHRPRQPINGVIVTVSVPDLLGGGRELEHQRAAVDARLQELRSVLGLELPLYLLVTKADLLAGFTEFFDNFDPAQREQVWGHTFEWREHGAALPGHDAITVGLGQLAQNLQARTLARLQDETAPARREPIYHLAAQLEALIPAVADFAAGALARAQQAPRQRLRGIYFSSGTQEGNPIDRVLGAIAGQHGVVARVLPRPDSKGKAFFLHRLLREGIVGEAALAAANPTRERRLRWAGGAALTVLALAVGALIAAWLLSYVNNRAYVASVGEHLERLVRQLEKPGVADATRWLPLYQVLRDLPRHGGVNPQVPPMTKGFGLFQGPRLARSAERTYHQVLAGTLAPALAAQLAGELRETNADMAQRYETLKIYLMLVQPDKLDRSLVRRWAAQGFARMSGAAGHPAEREEWLGHVDALLERNAFQAALTLDEPAVQAARQALRGLPLAQRAAQRLTRLADAAPEAGPARRLDTWLGPEFGLLFDPLDANAAPGAVPTLYTRAGFVARVLPRIESTLQQLADEEAWLLGPLDSGAQGWPSDAAGRRRLIAEVAALYAADYAAHWDKVLGGWQLHRPGDADALARLTKQLVAPDSPLRRLFELVGSELNFADLATAQPTRSPVPGPASPLAEAAAKSVEAVLAAHFKALRGYAGGPGPTAIDRGLNAVARFTLAGGADAGGLSQTVRDKLIDEASLAPAPLRGVWAVLADAVLAVQQSQLREGLGARLEDVAAQCRLLIGNRYPFTPGAVSNDVGFADFARLFGPDGLLDRFFRKELAPHLESTSRPWRFRAGAALAGEGLLRGFERAEDIRRVFFGAATPLPRLQFTLRPIEMDETLDEFSIDIDGQLLRYENGPRLVRSFGWPGPAGEQAVTLRATGLRGEAHVGPWALLRVLSRQPWQRGETSAQSRVRVALEGRALELDLALTPSAPAPLPVLLASFRCPQERP